MNNSDAVHPTFFNAESPWNNNPNPIWLGSTVTISRNIEKFNFPDKLSNEKSQQIIALIARELLKNPQLKHPRLIQAEAINQTQKEYLVEHFLSDQGFEHMHVGEAFVIDDTGEFLAMINLKDHLSLHLLDLSEEVENTWDRLAKIEMELDKSLKFAFSPKFGFLTTDPSQCGTALNVHIFLHLPALIYTDRLKNAVEKCEEEGIDYSGLQGSPTDFIGDVIAFKNIFTLGVKEETILSSLRTLATKLIVEEKGIRQHLKQANEEELGAIKDKVSRAYGILMHSYQIEEIETLEALSLLKLGLDLGWIKNVNQSDLNKLLFSSRRAHSLSRNTAKTTHQELPHRRSEFIHQSLKGMELLI